MAIPGSGVGFRANNSLASVFGESGFARSGGGVGFNVPRSCACAEITEPNRAKPARKADLDVVGISQLPATIAANL
jgi:hypothetical protein